MIPERYLQRALQGLDGWYSSAELLPTYNTWAAHEGKPETTIQELGQSIGTQFTCDSRKAHDNTKVWKIDERALNHRNWFRE